MFIFMGFKVHTVALIKFILPFSEYINICAQCRIAMQFVIFKLCERSELVNISQLFHSFSQTRLLVQQSLEVYDTQTVRIRSIRMDFLLPKIRSVRMSLEVYESMVKFFEIF